MSPIEQKFFDAWNDISDDEEIDDSNKSIFGLCEQVPVGIYIVDFVLGECAIEIDGHEYHKTKEQRYQDARRDRFLIREGYTVVRFIASEVFVDAKSCALEAIQIANKIEIDKASLYTNGFKAGQSKKAVLV